MITANEKEFYEFVKNENNIGRIAILMNKEMTKETEINTQMEKCSNFLELSNLINEKYCSQDIHLSNLKFLILPFLQNYIRQNKVKYRDAQQ